MKVDRYMFYNKYDIQWLDDEYGIYLYEWERVFDIFTSENIKKITPF